MWPSPRYVDRILEAIPSIPYDTMVAREHAEILVAVRRFGQPRAAHDLIIAATARATDRTIVTADAGAFRGLPGIEIRAHR